MENCFVFDIFTDAPDCEKSIEFADYIVNTYIDPTSKFPPQIWADADVECKRTTNGCESFHKEFSQMFYHSHPNIFDFLEKFKGVQTKSNLKIRAARNVLPFPLSRKENDNLRQKIELKEKYQNGELNRLQYV